VSVDAALKDKEFSTNSAGIQGIVRKVKASQAADDRTAEEAFKDLSALMKRAQEIVALADKFSKSKEASDGSASEKESFTALLHNMGIPSPVTRQSAGAAYHVQLSRQLADFLTVPLNAAGGMLALVDVYCAFNRARGTELISPDDLTHACELFGQLGIPLRLRRFELSGVLCVQQTALTDAATSQRIVATLAKLRAQTPQSPSGAAGEVGVTELQLSQQLGISLVLAKQQLLVAEQLQVVVRDESREGLRFFTNIFPQFGQ